MSDKQFVNVIADLKKEIAQSMAAGKEEVELLDTIRALAAELIAARRLGRRR